MSKLRWQPLTSNSVLFRWKRLLHHSLTLLSSFYYTLLVRCYNLLLREQFNSFAIKSLHRNCLFSLSIIDYLPLRVIIGQLTFNGDDLGQNAMWVATIQRSISIEPFVDPKFCYVNCRQVVLSEGIIILDWLTTCRLKIAWVVR